MKYILFSVAIVVWWGVVLGTASECLIKRDQCEDGLKNSKKKLLRVCGTDNVTYMSDCALEVEQCQGKKVEIKHYGRCRNKKPCFKDLKKIQGLNQAGTGGFVPNCLKDGRYSPVQCHEETGYCWCVTPKGRPIPNTSRRYHKPNCTRRLKTRRRASARKSDREFCARSDKLEFNENLINLFRAEYGKHVAATPEHKDKILSWKFDAMDVDGDGFLKRPEYKLLRRLKKLVKPKKCAKTFAKLCDLDRDLQLSKEEWLACLGPSAQGQLKGSTVAVASLSGQLPGLEPGGNAHRKDEPEANDCLSDRQAVLAEQRSDELYVPECEEDGRYNRIQCYRSTGYCWCVHEDNGKPIPGTSVKDQVPKCDAIPVPVRPMKGCPGEKKEVFLKDLMVFLSTKLLGMNGTYVQQDRLASLSFASLDSNNNKHLERKEWKTFRAMVASSKGLRRCGKRLPRFCDVNNDRRISITEWTQCLRGSAHQHLPLLTATPTTSISTSPVTSQSKRRGPNPLESYLKDDDDE